MIFDLHCDLLLYLEKGEGRTPFDLASRCSIPQLREGGIKHQIFALFTETSPMSVVSGKKQLKIFQGFLKSDSLDVSPASVIPFLAIENASSFCSEDEPLKEGLKRFNEIIDSVKPLYISLTWNTENRFGGGAHTMIGLKEDGKRVLELLSEVNIALDVSHASDPLAYESIDFIEKNNLNLSIIASHSNSRHVKNVPRNLPDAIAKEIIKRKGLIGLNLCRQFIGEKEEDILEHLLHWLELKGEDVICFGADFFYEADVPSSKGKTIYFRTFQDASCYKHLIAFIQKELKLPQRSIDKLASLNAETFFGKKRKG